MAKGLRYPIWIAVVAAAVAAGYYLNTTNNGLAAATPPTTPAKYVFVAGGADPYWELCVAGAREAAEGLGAEVDVLLPTGEGEEGLREQVGWLAELAGKEIDGVAVGPIDPDRQTTLINSLADKTTVVTVDSDVPGSRRMFYVGSSNYEAGGIAAELVQEALPGGGKVAVLLATKAKTNAAERYEGFEEALAESDADYTIVDTGLDQGDYDKCREIVRAAVEEHPDLGAIVCTFGYHGPIALETLGKIEGGDGVRLIAFDEDPRVLEAIRDGRVYATIVQDPFLFGSKAIEMLHDVRSGKYLALPIAGRVDVGVHCSAIDGDNLDDFQDRLAKRLGSTEPTVE